MTLELASHDEGFHTWHSGTFNARPRGFHSTASADKEPQRKRRKRSISCHNDTFVVDRFIVTKVEARKIENMPITKSLEHEEETDHEDRQGTTNGGFAADGDDDRVTVRGTDSSESLPAPVLDPVLDPVLSPEDPDPVTPPHSPAGHRRDSLYPADLTSNEPQRNPWRGRCVRFSQPLSIAAARVGRHPLCPSKIWIIRLISMFIIGLLFSISFIILGGSGLMHILICSVVAQIVGQVVHRVTSLPPLLGMLAVGACARNLGYIVEFRKAGHDTFVFVVRAVALVVLMIRAGFRLDPTRIRSLPSLMLGLAILPGLAEWVAVVILAYYVLALPWAWAMLLGVILAAACPSVIRPCFSRMGAGQSVHSVLLATACLNDVIAISVYGLMLAVLFSRAPFTYMLMHRLLGAGGGFLLGLVYGIFARYVPEKNDPHVVTLRSFMLGSLGVLAVLGFENVGFVGGGPVACMVASIVSCRGWQSQSWVPHYNPVATVFDVLWRIAQPVMFCLIGAELVLPDLPLHELLVGVGVLLAAWAIRFAVSMAVTSSGDLSIRERIHVTLAWIPKADVQAALCPLALDLARKRFHDDPSVHDPAMSVLLLVLLAVVLTAPLSAALTARTGICTMLLRPEEGGKRPGEPGSQTTTESNP